MPPLTHHQPELSRLPDDDEYGLGVFGKRRPSHAAWLARRTAELRGDEPEPVTSEQGFDGRAA